MAGRGRTSYQKRQKEQLRLEKRQQKAARKEARKAGTLLGPSDEEYQPDEPLPGEEDDDAEGDAEQEDE
ncbi:MAG TPA: hypothetical protein VN428_22665 [Bryobacteraceae bacterium]|nr:hypothetical protein [Bryobacteraceae bacterium]